jgi:uncharacterized membrane protein
MRKHQSLFAAAAFGALSGGRSAIGPALLALEKQQRKGVFGARIGRVATILEAMAAVELVADKLPVTTSRTRPFSLLARATSGAVVGAALSPKLRRAGAVVGAAAVATTFGLHRLRGLLTNRLRVPNLIAGALEDALVIGLGSRLASRVA